MRPFRFCLLGLAILAAAPPVSAEPGHHSKYAGRETREIKSLSAEDIAELRRGGGWGLAQAAELNGLPGPVHLLELKDAIALTPLQVSAIETLYEDMKSRAIAEGKKFIALEKALDDAAKNRDLTDDRLKTLLGRIEKARRNLRYIHLSTHLKTPEILSRAQMAKYNALRGYTSDPCAKVPEGHDPDLWRRHNKCG